MEKASREWLQSEDSKPEFVDLVVGPGQDEDNRRFGELLSRIRQHAGRTRVEVATELDLSTEYLRLIELGQRTPALGQMMKFLEAYRAIGEVKKLQPGGDRPDLLISDIYTKEPVVVEFKSRIREARRSETRSARMKASPSDKYGFPESMEDGQAKDYATDFRLVIRLLSHADHETIIKVRDLLQAEIAE